MKRKAVFSALKITKQFATNFELFHRLEILKIRLLILLGLLLATEILSAQTDFRPGYIIEATGDTIYGQIDYRGDLLMSRLCRFKGDDNIIKRYSPNDILAFRFFDSKYYVTREINYNKVFMEYLIKGIVNIYYTRDENGAHYFIDKEGIKITEIPYEEGIKYVDGRKVFYESTKHIGFLSTYMKDAPELQSRIQAIKRPEYEVLIKLAEDYHNAVCESEQCIIYEKRLPLLKISISPFLGLIKYSGYNKFSNEFGVYLSLWSPKISEKFFLKTGIGHHKFTDNNDNINVYKVPLHLQYIFKAHKIQPNISAGINLLSLKYYNFNVLGNTLSLNAGLDYKIFNKINLTTSFNSDFTPISMLILDENRNFDMIAYSVNIGLRFDF